MAIEIPGLDVNSGLDLCDGDRDVYLNSLRLYVSSMPASLEKMRDVSEGTLKDYFIIAHRVKGMSEHAGAEEIRKAAKQLEAMAKDGDLAGVLERNEAFINHAQNIVDGIRSWLAENYPER